MRSSATHTVVTQPERGIAPVDSAALARRIVDIQVEKNADDIILLDIRRLSVIADYFVICSADTDRQVQAISRAVIEGLEAEGTSPLHIEGLTDSPSWVLLDYGDVVAHIFRTSEREYYRLERVWSDAPTILRIQ
jgi:ribosome-associated protein